MSYREHQCQEFACNRPAKMEKSGRYYCSDFCVQLDQSHQLVTKSVAIPASSLTGATAHSAASLKEEMMTASETQNDSLNVPSKSGELIIQTKTSTERSDVSVGEDEWKEMPPLSERGIANTDSQKTHVVASVERLQSFDGDTSSSVNLIDDSIMHLHKLAKSVGNLMIERATKSGDSKNVDPALLNSAAHLTKQMSSMLRLKLDYHKATRDK